jgi:Glycosyl transferase family 2
VVHKGSRLIFRRLGGQPGEAPPDAGKPVRGVGPVGRDLTGLATAPMPASSAAADGRVDPLALAAIERLDDPLEAPAPAALEPVLRDPAVSEVVKAYCWRVFEATHSGRRPPAWPQCRVAARPEILARDPLALLFLHHLFAFRAPIVEWTRPESEGPLVIRDDEIGVVTVEGDGIQTLSFRFPERGTVARHNVGAAVRHPSFDFLTAGPAAPAPNPIGPMFSVVIPVYDRTTELMAAVGSVLNQEYPWCELVLVFNGSPSETLALVPRIRRLAKARRYRERLLVLPRAYGAATIPRNIGGFAATGDVIVFLDSDDTLEAPGFLARAAQRVASTDERCALFYPATVEFVNTDRDHWIRGRLVCARPPRCDWDVLYTQGNVLNNTGVGVRRARFLQIGGLDASLEYCEDYELYMRAVGKSRYGLPVEAGVQITLHRGNNEIRFEANKLDWLRRAQQLAEAFTAREP